MSLQTKIEAKMKDIKASKSKASPEIQAKIEAKMAAIKGEQQKEKLQDKITQTIEREKSLKNPTKGKGSTILERLGTDLSQSGGLYDKCFSGKDCAGVLLRQLDRYLEFAVSTGQHELIYQNANSLLMSIDRVFYLIDQNDMKKSIKNFAHNAGVPMEYVGSAEMAKALIEGIIKLWQKHSANYDEINHLVR